MSRLFKNIKGTFDILPSESESDGASVPASGVWRAVETRIHEIMALYDVREIRTPILEPTELVARGIGELTDIVAKEMFAFERGKTKYVLRPEVTAPVMRAYLQHHLHQSGGVQRLYYLGSCFRAERPQKGRYRQFHQFGVEFIGSAEPVADAETIALMISLYQSLGVTRTRLRINTLGDEDSRPRYRRALQQYFKPHQDKLSETSLQRLESNPLRILDTKLEQERALLENAPRLIDFVDSECRQNYDHVKTMLTDIGIDYEEDDFLVRGLDYYTRTAFELESPDLGAQSALAGGGRYDLLAREIGSPTPVPAVGFAAGFERLLLAMAACRSLPSESEAPDAFIVALGDEAVSRTFVLAQDLRGKGLRIAYDMMGRSMKAQMREANRQQAPVTIIIGKDELEQGVATVKVMQTGDQSTARLEELGSLLLSRQDNR